MPLAVSFRIGESKARVRTYASKQECDVALAEAVRRNRALGNNVRTEEIPNEPHPQWIVETPSGKFVAMYQLTTVTA